MHSQKPPLVVLFTRPGGGKGTQLKALQKEYDSSVFGTGEYIRNNVPNNSELAEFFSKSRGATLLPDRLILPPTVRWLEAKKDNPSIKILDGVPRNISQCQLFEFAQSFGMSKRIIVHIDVPELVCNDRILERAKLDPSRSHELDPEVRGNRFREHDKETAPVLEFVVKQGLARVYSIHTDGLEDPDRITFQIRTILGQEGILPNRIRNLVAA